MEPATTIQPPVASGTPVSPKTPDLVGLGHRLGERHGAAANPGSTKGQVPAGNGHTPQNKGGRRTVEQEARDWLAKNGLVATPAPAATGNPPPVDPLNRYVVDPDFVSGCTKTLLEGISAFRQRQVALKVMVLTPDKAIAREFAEEASGPPGGIEVMAKCAAEMAQKYEWLNAASPEALFIITGIIWVAMDMALWRRLDALAEQKRKDSQAQTKESQSKPAEG